MVLLRIMLLLALCSALAVHVHADDAKLVRVVVLARHGNRAPNLQLQELCPNFMTNVFPGFGVPLTALSRVGMAENWESGVYLRSRYIEQQPFVPPMYMMDGTASFFAERMGRNIISTQALVQGMYPDGTGLEGYLKSRPNVVDIATTQKGVDELMNCPRDGPCKPNYRADFAEWVAANENRVYQEHQELFLKLQQACGTKISLVPGLTYQGKAKNIPWAIKAINDALTFSANEGLDGTLGGQMTPEDLKELKAVTKEMIDGTRFNSDHQMTYWVSNFLPNLFKLAVHKSGDTQWYHDRFHLFLNHRELLLAVAHILQLAIPFDGGNLVPGCSLTFEIWEQNNETFMKFFWWGPTAPSAADKQKALAEEDSLLGLYPGGGEFAVAPPGCTANELCPFDLIKKLFKDFVNTTGTYQQICHVSAVDPSADAGSDDYETATPTEDINMAAAPPSSGPGALSVAGALLVFAVGAFAVRKLVTNSKRGEYDDLEDHSA